MCVFVGSPHIGIVAFLIHPSFEATFLGNGMQDLVQIWNWGCPIQNDIAKKIFLHLFRECRATAVLKLHVICSCKIHSCPLHGS